MNRENKPKTVWDLKDGDVYYIIYPKDIECCTFNGHPFDITLRENGDMFLTQEEAEFELERRKIEAVMKKYSVPFESGKCNWSIYYDHFYNTVGIAHWGNSDLGGYYFETKEIAQQVIEEVGEERLKKYWFGVEKRCEFCGNENVDYKSENIYACRNCENELLEYLEENNLIKTEKETVTHYFDTVGNYVTNSFDESTEEIIANMVDDESIDLERI